MSGATGDHGQLHIHTRGAHPFVKMINKGALTAVHTHFVPSPTTPVHAIPSFGSGQAYLVSVQLEPLDNAELWCNGQPLPRLKSPRAGVHIFDLRHRWRARMLSQYHSMTFAVSASSLADAGETRVGETASLVLPEYGTTHIDQTLLHLALALAPAFDRPDEISTLFAEHITTAVACHMFSTYAQWVPSVARPQGGLALWQQRRVTDMLLSRLDADISTAELAAACNLSSGHFTRAFRHSFGLPPHRWLLRERVRRATEMLQTTSHRLDEIALACGFFDQSHLTRVFRTATGQPPASWRRANAPIPPRASSAAIHAPR